MEKCWNQGCAQHALPDKASLWQFSGYLLGAWRAAEPLQPRASQPGVPRLAGDVRHEIWGTGSEVIT